MTSQVLSRQYGLFLGGNDTERTGRRLRKTLIVSLVIHLCILVLLAGFRFRRTVELPLSAVQVSLVQLPAQEADKVEPRVEKVRPTPKPVQPAPIPVPPKPVQQSPAQTKPAPPPPMQAKAAPAPSPPVHPTPDLRPAPVLSQAPLPAPTMALPQPVPQAVRPVAAAPVRSRRDVMQELLKDIELPPNAPDFGDVSPPKPAEARRPMQAKLERTQERPPSPIDLNKLRVPEMAAPVELPKEQVKPQPVPPKLPSLSEEVDREFKELKPIQTPPIVKLPEPVQESKPMFREPPQQALPPVTASVPKVQKAPETKLKVLSGSSSGANAYLALVQRAINERWTAPPVDISGTALTVVIKFHLSRSGLISGVEFKQQSGNGWYDDAGRRAVMSVERLPPFPPNITEQSYDIYFTFAVGEGTG